MNQKPNFSDESFNDVGNSHAESKFRLALPVIIKEVWQKALEMTRKMEERQGRAWREKHGDSFWIDPAESDI